jgi:hypothetical protein
MRPKKKILLVGGDEERVSCLRYLLTTCRFAVITASDAKAAEGLLIVERFDLLVCDWPLAGVEWLLTRAKAIDPNTPTLLLAYTAVWVPQGCVADKTLCKGEFGSAVLLEWARELAVRKRGPRPGKKPVASVGAAQLIMGTIKKGITYLTPLEKNNE